MPISAAYPFESRYIDVEGSQMHYMEQGAGDPILFLHGNPTSSYLWRNIIPIVAPKGRCIAPDLIGFGKSDKPDIDYGYTDHVKYVDGFIEALGLKNLTLVLHDWGGAFGLDYTLRHQDNVKAVTFFESVSFTLSWDSFLEDARETFQGFRTSEVGWNMICKDNIFIEKLLPSLVMRPLEKEELDYYRMPFPTEESRKPIWRMPNMLPFDDDKTNPDYLAVKNIEDSLPSLSIPLLLLWAEPGALFNQERVKAHQERIPNLSAAKVGQGLHYIQEDCPDEIGKAIVEWMDNN